MPNVFQPALDRISDSQETQLKAWVHLNLHDGTLPSYEALLCDCSVEARASNIEFSCTPGQQDFRYRRIGASALSQLHADYSGRYLADMPGKGPGSSIWQFVTDIATTRRPSINIAPYVGPTSNWSHVTLLGLPVADDGEAVDHVILVVDFVLWPFLKESSDVKDKTNSLRKYLFEIRERAKAGWA